MAMREILISDVVLDKIDDLKDYLVIELRLSEEAALRRVERINTFLKSFSASIDYPLCRFKKWRLMGYRCAVFEKNWIFAYEIFVDGVIVRDMVHTAVLCE